MKNLMAVGVAGLVLAGCASAGTNYDQEAVYRLQLGDDIRSVVGTLGRPNVETVDDKGNTVLVWVHSSASVLGAEATSVRLTFDAQGRLIAVPRRPIALGVEAEREATPNPAPQPVAIAAVLSVGVTAPFSGRPMDAVTKARVILEAEGFAVSADAASAQLTTVPITFPLRPEHADCGRMLGIPFLADRRAKSTVAYRVVEGAGSVTVQVALNSVYEPGTGAGSRVLSCVSSGALERQLLARIAG